MSRSTDMRVRGVSLYFLPVNTRVPLKFGTEALTSVTCARVCVHVEGRDGRTALGWGETPLSVQWVWPSTEPYSPRHETLKAFTAHLARAWAQCAEWGHPMELGQDFISHQLPGLRDAFHSTQQGSNNGGEPASELPWLAALVACSPFDLALHDAYGRLHGCPTYTTYGPDHMNRDLAAYLQPTEGVGGPDMFRGKYPRDFFRGQRADSLEAWHLVGGLDPLHASELSGQEPQDGYPVLLTDWIRRDELRCLKVKLRGSDAAWDMERLIRVGEIAVNEKVDWLTADFNCTVHDPEYVTRILDELRDEYPRIYGMLLYVEQPFPYELTEHPIPVHSVSARKPLFLDESAHDWAQVRLGRSLGWNGVALKTCKTQTGALLSACWAQAHGMTLMVQDLTNPMLAQVTHCLLAAHVPTIMGVETNGMQFYPEASLLEAKIHPGLYQRRQGRIHLNTAHGPGFGYRENEIQRPLPQPQVVHGTIPEVPIR